MDGANWPRRFRILFQLAAQPRHVHIHRAHVGGLVTPHRFQDLLPREWLVTGLQKKVRSSNTWAVFRSALGYPDERHLERVAGLCETVPRTLAELRSLYIDLFEAGLPQPRCPLLESAWLLNRPAGEVILENKLYYQNFGLEIDGRAAPDHLPAQLECAAWPTSRKTLT
jgi:hypothetical protein